MKMMFWGCSRKLKSEIKKKYKIFDKEAFKN
jgi:hypothetical protein